MTEVIKVNILSKIALKNNISIYTKLYFYNGNKKSRKTIGQELAKQALKKLCPNFDMDKIEILYSLKEETKGKPYFIIDQEISSNIDVSISHSKECYAAVVGKDVKVGIDIQYILTNTDALNQILSKEELKISRYLHKNSLIALTILWSIKEAIGKLIGTGFRYGINSFVLSKSKNNQEYILNILDYRLRKQIPKCNNIYVYYENYLEYVCVLAIVQT